MVKYSIVLLGKSFHSKKEQEINYSINLLTELSSLILKLNLIMCIAKNQEKTKVKKILTLIPLVFLARG